jgi:hypothetical protein
MAVARIKADPATAESDAGELGPVTRMTLILRTMNKHVASADAKDDYGHPRWRSICWSHL